MPTNPMPPPPAVEGGDVVESPDGPVRTTTPRRLFGRGPHDRILDFDGGPNTLTYLRCLRELELRQPGLVDRADLFAGISDGALAAAYFASRRSIGLAEIEACIAMIERILGETFAPNGLEPPGPGSCSATNSCASRRPARRARSTNSSTCCGAASSRSSRARAGPLQSGQARRRGSTAMCSCRSSKTSSRSASGGTKRPRRCGDRPNGPKGGPTPLRPAQDPAPQARDRRLERRAPRDRHGHTDVPLLGTLSIVHAEAWTRRDWMMGPANAQAAAAAG